MNEITFKKKDTSRSLITYQIILYVAMMSGYKGIAYYVSFMFVALFCMKFIMRSRENIPTNKSWNSFMLFLVFYFCTSVINFDSRNFFTYFIYYIIVFFPILISEYLKRNSTTRMMIASVNSFIGVFVAFSLISIGYYLTNPGLAREMAAHLTEGKLAIGGGYSLSFAAAIICVYVFSKILNKRIEKKLRYIFICAVCFYLVYLTESSITFFAMFIGLIVSVIVRGRETSSVTASDFLRLGCISILVLIATAIIIYNKYSIAEWVLDFINGKDDNILYSRIEEIINKLIYGKTNFHVDKRSNTLTTSIEIFKQYPIFGMGYKYGNVFRLGKQLGMGNHSEILDSFARYGIVGGVLWLSPYFRALKQIFIKNFGCAITILIMMCFNPFMSFHSNAVMFLFIPLVEEILNRKEQKNIEAVVGEVS